MLQIVYVSYKVAVHSAVRVHVWAPAFCSIASAGVVLYGAAMSLVARRYRNKKKRARHSRNSSITGQPAWMHGAGYRDSHSSGSRPDRSMGACRGLSFLSLWLGTNVVDSEAALVRKPTSPTSNKRRRSLLSESAVRL